MVSRPGNSTNGENEMKTNISEVKIPKGWPPPGWVTVDAVELIGGPFCGETKWLDSSKDVGDVVAIREGRSGRRFKYMITEKKERNRKATYLAAKPKKRKI